MPCDLDLESRPDRLAAQLGTYTKKKMFGGVGYMMKGNMAFGIHKQSLLVRTSVEQAESLLKKDTHHDTIPMTGHNALRRIGNLIADSMLYS